MNWDLLGRRLSTSATCLVADERISFGHWGQLVWDERDARFEAHSCTSSTRQAEIESGMVGALRGFVAGKFMLHGSCVAKLGRAIALVGPSRAGKSTVAAMVAQRGATLVSDGMTLLDPRTLAVSVGPRRFKLFDDSIVRLGLEPAEFRHVNEDADKRYVTIAGPADECITLTDAYCFVNGEAPEVRELSLQDQVMSLVANGILATRLPPRSAAIHLQRAAQAVQSGLRVHQLVRKRSWDQADALVELVTRLLDQSAESPSVA